MNTSTAEPLVSVILPTFNGEKYLDDALKSVYSQTYQPYEVIVVDDGSRSGRVSEICQKYGDKLTYVRQENRGVSAARNAGIRASRGVYIAFLDDDDLWRPEKLKKQVGLFERLAADGIAAGLIYTGYQDLLENGECAPTTTYPSAGFNYRTLLFINFVDAGGSSAVVPKRVLDAVGLFDEALPYGEDWDLAIRIARKHPIYSVDEPLTLYRNRPDSASKNMNSVITNTFRVLDKAMEAEAREPLIDPQTQRSVYVKHHREFALACKNAAYQQLFAARDGAGFRRLIRLSRQNDASFCGPKVAVYYLLSFVSPGCCGWIKRFKRDTAAPAASAVVPVSDLRF